MAHEPKTSLRYETAGCLLTLFLAMGVVGGWFLTLVISAGVLVAFFRRIQLAEGFIIVFVAVWLVVMCIVMRAVVLRGLTLYDRIMHRWFADDHQKQVQ
jgi:hypothetical protein